MLSCGNTLFSFSRQLLCLKGLKQYIQTSKHHNRVHRDSFCGVRRLVVWSTSDKSELHSQFRYFLCAGWPESCEKKKKENTNFLYIRNAWNRDGTMKTSTINLIWGRQYLHLVLTPRLKDYLFRIRTEVEKLHSASSQVNAKFNHYQVWLNI